MAVGSPPPDGRSLDRAARGSPARCGLSGFPVAVGPAVGAHGGDGGVGSVVAGLRFDPMPTALLRDGRAAGGRLIEPRELLGFSRHSRFSGAGLATRSGADEREGAAVGGAVRTGAGVANPWGILAGLRFVSLPESRALPSPATKRPRRVDAKRRPRTESGWLPGGGS